MINFLNKFARHQKENGVEYHVRATRFFGGEYDLVFTQRKDAKAYKQLIKKSKSEIKSHITRREFFEGNIIDEREVY